MTTKDIYETLANHISHLGLGLPYNQDLVEILSATFTPIEAEVALTLPTGVIPMKLVTIDDIPKTANLSKDQILEVLEDLSRRGLLFSGKTKDGEKGYSLLQMGFGFPQVYHWKGEDTPQARKMAELVIKYYADPKVTKQAYGSETKAYRYIPIGQTIPTGMQAVYPYHMMEKVIEQADVFAVAHCSCRVRYRLKGEACDHPTEVCMKFNDMAEWIIDAGLGRKITKDEAHDIIKMSEDAGLVHFVDNAETDIKHNCNCCGCACWNVGNIRRRNAPRDFLMATYFLRETDEEKCTGCGDCVDVCPVDALKTTEDLTIVDEQWCIGCGVCANVCPNGAITMRIRPDKTGRLPASNVMSLHETILEEKGLG